MSPSIGTIVVVIFFDSFIAIHSRSTLNKLYSDTSNRMMHFGSLSNSCLAISEPIEPPAPEISNVFSEALLIKSFATLALGKRSSRDKFCISVIFF